MSAAPISVGRTIAVGAIVLALVGLGAWWAVPSWAELVAAADRLGAAPPRLLALAALMALAPTAIEAIRVRVVARALGVTIAGPVALDAAAANSFFTAVTPAAGLGEPAVAWVLGRRGVDREVALAVPLAKFTTSFVVVFALGAAVFASGSGAPEPWLGRSGAALCALCATLMLGVIVIGRSPARAQAALRWLGRGRVLRRATDRLAVEVVPSLARLGALRAVDLIVLAATHVAYFAAYVAPLAIVCEALTPGTGATAAPRALGYLCATFLAPTPGGAGVAEASSAAFFGDLIGRPDAVIAVIGFRIARFISQVVVCGGYLAARGLWQRAVRSPAGRDAADEPRADR